MTTPPLLTHDLLVRLCAARELLRADTDPPMTLAQIAREAEVPLTQLIRRFSTLFGETPHRYRSRLRLDRASSLLVQPGASVTEVCMAVGYSSLGSFSSKFARHFGVAPLEYRRRFFPSASISPADEWLCDPGCCGLMIAALGRGSQFSRSDASAAS